MYTIVALYLPATVVAVTATAVAVAAALSAAIDAFSFFVTTKTTMGCM